MSMYSGKCDVGDHFDGRSDEFIANSNFYIYSEGRHHRLDIHNRKDLLPYYPFLISSMGSDKNRSTVYISSMSYVDIEEQERLTWYLREAIKYWKKCKRNKIKFNKEEIINQLNLFHNTQPDEFIIEIVNLVDKNGDKATINGIHLKLHDIYRQNLMDEMIKNGYDEDYAYKWCFGFERWLNEQKKEKRETSK